MLKDIEIHPGEDTLICAKLPVEGTYDLRVKFYLTCEFKDSKRITENSIADWFHTEGMIAFERILKSILNEEILEQAENLCILRINFTQNAPASFFWDK